jgi:hypothetical protein
VVAEGEEQIWLRAGAVADARDLEHFVKPAPAP